MIVVAVLFASILALCFGISLVQAYDEAKREGRAVIPALLKRAGVVFIQLWI